MLLGLFKTFPNWITVEQVIACTCTCIISCACIYMCVLVIMPYIIVYRCGLQVKGYKDHHFKSVTHAETYFKKLVQLQQPDGGTLRPMLMCPPPPVSRTGTTCSLSSTCASPTVSMTGAACASLSVSTRSTHATVSLSTTGTICTSLSVKSWIYTCFTLSVDNWKYMYLSLLQYEHNFTIEMPPCPTGPTFIFEHSDS